jgi:hypothetical protein
VSAMLEAALEYAARGFRVHPLRDAGKEPRVKAWPERATTEAPKIRRWWSEWPEANVGIATGDGIAVLDVDPRNGGDETLEAYVYNTNGIGMTTTAEVLTGGNGRHLYFAAPPGLRSAVLGPGLDLKAEGGYVLAPPSIHPETGKEYVWHPERGALLRQSMLPGLPQWAIHKGARVHQARPDAHWAKIAREGFGEGERNTGAASYIGHLLSYLDPEEVFELVFLWNRARNKPPLPNGELHKVFMSIARRQAEQERQRSARW